LNPLKCFSPAVTLALALCGVSVCAATTTTTPVAAPAYAPVNAMPYYGLEDALHGIYVFQIPPLAQRFQTQSEQLVRVTESFCQGDAPVAAVRTQWQTTQVSWEALLTPSVGPLVSRRSQRQIDFWPTRPELINRALKTDPKNLTDMERVGTPAKGLPAMEWLLAQWSAPGQAKPAARDCRFVSLVAQGIAEEARALDGEFATLAAKDWADSPDQATAAMAEWVNQWLAGLERLRWAHIEKPIVSHQTRHADKMGDPIAFPRLSVESNLAGWQAQWHSLLTQARLTEAQYRNPPPAGKSLVPIEALLLGKGKLALAGRWVAVLDKVSVAMAALKSQSTPSELLALTQLMKAVTVLFQNEVATALDIPLGFSDADGD
jgi:predicted lipoprotein